MTGEAASAGFREPPGSGHVGTTAGPDDVTLGAVLTLVLWLGCMTVGVLGLTLPYQGPTSLVIESAPVQARIVNVEIIRVPLSPPDTLPSLAASRTPPTAPAPTVMPKAAPLMAVAVPSAAIAFALPLEGPMRVVAPAEASYVSPLPPPVAPSAPPPAQPLTFGRGEGKQPAPDYPREAIRAGQEGTVRVGLTVSEEGCVLAAEIVAPSPWPLLNEAAFRTVRLKWRFAPGTVRRYEVPIRFQLQK